LLNTIKKAIKNKEIRKKLLYTLVLIIVFRIGCMITVPGVNVSVLDQYMNIQQSNGLASTINLLSGGAFSRFSIFAMSIGPYITSSIILQLLMFVIPSLEKLAKEGGEEGKRKMNRYTKIITLALATVEALGIYLTYKDSGIFINQGFNTAMIVVISLIAGTAFLVWLGDQITKKGIGNGISILIFIGIITSLPQMFSILKELAYPSAIGAIDIKGLIIALAILAGAIALIAGVVWVQEAERRIPVQYAKRVVGRKMYGGQNTHIPLKLAMAGVMPIIFAMQFMMFPAMIISFFTTDPNTLPSIIKHIYYVSAATNATTPSVAYPIANAIIYLVLIIGFTFFYTMMMFNPVEVANNIKKNGGFIPGIRAGKPTSDYLSSVTSKLTCFGSIFLAIVAIIPILIQFTGIGIQFGGTAILIVVGVALETIKQLESQLSMRTYKGFLE